MASAARGDTAQAPQRASWVKRIVLATAMAVVGLNIWTGGPLLSVWLGSRVQGTGPPTMSAVFIVIVALIAITLGLTWSLARLGAAYDRATGREIKRGRRQAPWLRSMRGERPDFEIERRGISGLERVLVVVVVLAFAAFEVWFFFFSGSSIGHN